MAKSGSTTKKRAKGRSNGKSGNGRKKGGLIRKIRGVLTREVPVVENTSEEEIHRIFELQRANRFRMRQTDHNDRIRRLKRLEQEILAKREDLYVAMGRDFRKAPREIDLTEVLPVINDLKDAIRNVKQWMAPKKAGTPVTLFGARSELVYEPRGVVLVIAPWNYPFHLAMVPVVQAIAAGNCVIIKPSEFTPETSRVIKEVIQTVFPEDEVAVVEGDHTVSQELTSLPFDHIFFTGSTEVGKIIMAAAAKNLATVTLELGGKSPAVIDETANMQKTAERLMWGKSVNAGQTCVAPDYILMPESRVGEFVTHATNAVRKFYGNTPEQIKDSKDFCRIVNARHYGRLCGLLEDAKKKGANVVMGGETDDQENFIAPTLLTEVKPDSKIMQEEIFGPLFPIITYNDVQEAINFINEREKPLALYIFSDDKKKANTLIERTSAGGTVVNDVFLHLANGHLPFGGVNHSGHGAYHGEFGFKELSHERAVLRQSKWLHTIKMMYPPYTPKVKTLMELMRKFLV